MDANTKHVLALVLFGAGAVLAAVGLIRWGLACVAGGLFVEAL